MRDREEGDQMLRYILFDPINKRFVFHYTRELGLLWFRGREKEKGD